MKINSGIWNGVNTLTQNYYNFSNNYTVYIQNVHDGYSLIGAKDADKFTFG
jgi:hypothetical protein